MENPYQSPAAVVGTEDEVVGVAQVVMRDYDGIGRLVYFGLLVLLSVTQVILTAAITEDEPSFAVDLILWFGFYGLSMLLVSYRLKNIGMNPWWCLGLLVPLLNVLIFIRCLICPEGYADTKKLDLVGKVLVCVFILPFLAFIGFLVVMAVTRV